MLVAAVLTSLSFCLWVKGELGAEGQLQRLTLRYYAFLDREGQFVRSPIGPARYLFLTCACATIAIFSLLYSAKVAFVFGLSAASPALILRRQRAHKVALVQKQVEPWMNALVRALEAAPSLGEAIVASISSTPEPLSGELLQLQNELQLGHSLERALNSLEERIGSPVLSLALATLRIGQRTGGELPVVLRDAAASLREMERLEGILRTKTAEGRSQSFVISVLPIPIFLGMNYTDPHHFDALKETAMGHILLTIAAGLWVAAIFCIKKILAVRI